MTSEKQNSPLNSSVDIKNITAPVITLLSIAGMIIWATNSVWEQKEAIKNEFRQHVSETLEKIEDQHREMSGTSRQQQELIHQLEDVIKIMKHRQRFILENVWTQKEHAIWCYEAQKKNQNFICPDEDLRKSGIIGSEKYLGPVDRDRKEILREMEEEGNGLFGPKLYRHNKDFYKK